MNYRTPEEAARNSRTGYAYSSNQFTLITPSHPMGVRAVIRYSARDGICYVYAGALGLKVKDAKPNSGDVDKIRQWGV